MAVDLTKLSDKDLNALINNDYASLSDSGLALLTGGEAPKPKPKTTAMQRANEFVSSIGPRVDKATQTTPISASGRSNVDELLRQLGLTARASISGALSIPAMLAEPVAAVTGRPSQTQQIQNILTQIGLPVPETSKERVVQDIAGSLAGVGAPARVAQMIKPASAYGKEIVDFLSSNLRGQVAAASGGAAGSSVAREEGAPEWAQMGAGLAGTIVPGSAATGVTTGARAARELVRPGTQAGREVIAGNVLQNLARSPQTAIKAMEEFAPTVTGYTPTAAQASRDFGLIAAETPIRAMDVTGKFAQAQSEANKARMSILDKMARDKDAVQAAIKKRDEVTAPMREEAFAKSTVDPETFQSAVNLTVNNTIEDILKSDVGARSTVENTMNWAKQQIQRGTTPQRLYEVRKDLRDASQGRLDKDGSAYSLAKGQLEQVIRSIDGTLEAAAPGYKDYLRKYAASSKGIERLEAAQEFRGKVLTTTPDPSNIGDFLISQPSFTRAIRAVEQDKDTKLSAAQIGVLKKLSADLDSGVLQRATKVPGSDTFKNLSTANVIGGIVGKQMFGEVPAGVNKLIAPLNWLYNGTDDQIRELLVDAMLDPKLASRLMTKANVMTIEPLSKELQRRAKEIGYGAAFGLQE